MAKSAKAPKKRAAATRKTKKSSAPDAAGLRNPRTLLFAAIFAVVGVFLLLQVSAKPSMLANPDEVIAAYYKSAPTSVSKDLRTGEVTFASATTGYAVLADGTLLCDDDITDGTVKTGKIGLGVVKQLHKEIEQLDIGTLPRSIAPEGTTEMISNGEGFILASSESVSNISLHEDSPKPDKLARMQEKLAKTCEKSADKSEPRGRTKIPKLPQAAKSSSQNSGVAGRLATIFTPKVHASATTTSTPKHTATIDSAFANVQWNETNNYRAGHGLYTLHRVKCLNDAAHAWAKYMAQHQEPWEKPKHNPNLAADIGRHCASSGLKYAEDRNKADGDNWTNMTENVGQGHSSLSMFHEYVNSPTHRANILTNASRCQGHGAYDSSNGLTYHVYVSAAWVGGTCQR